MSISIDTKAVKRLRDMLLEEGRLPGQPAQQKSSAHRKAELERVAPIAETMFLVVMADGHAAVSETESLKGAIRVLTQGVLGDHALEELLARCNRNPRCRAPRHPVRSGRCGPGKQAPRPPLTPPAGTGAA